jgi:hypothetical protein
MFGSWHSLRSDFTKCVDHVLSSWSESRHNPNFSRFDAINNKFDKAHNNHSERMNMRALMPPLIPSRALEFWFYQEFSDEDQIMNA